MTSVNREAECRPPQLGRAQRLVDHLGLSGPAELILAFALLVLLIAFKLTNTARYKFDTDESQHLHVIWGWARGFVQYRDLCDNHMPLFQILFAPVYGLIGDRPGVLLCMRFVLLPLYGVVAWSTYRIGALAFSKRVGLWAVIMAGFYPGYHFCSLEFRTDNLWAPLWLLSVVILLQNGLNRRSACSAGILMGLCFGVSMKTTLLLISVVVGGTLSTWLVNRGKLRLLPWRELAFSAALYLATALLVPAIIILAFASAGLWPAFCYWVFENNVLPGLRNHPAWWIFILPVSFPLVVAAAAWLVRRAPTGPATSRRTFLFLVWGFYVPALWSFWPLVTRQDYLPYQPLAFVLYSALLLFISNRLVRKEAGTTIRLLIGPAPVAVSFFLIALLAHPFWVDGAKPETDLLRSTLQLTSPGDFVLDQKGETVFRQRAFAPIWEPLVMERIRRGLMPDNAAQRCLETRTCVATKERDMSEQATRFVERYYLSVGTQLYVAGSFLEGSASGDGTIGFEIAIPAAYRIVAKNSGPVQGSLDGTPYAGEARALAPGWHSLSQSANASPLAVVWAQAIDRGFSPFPRNTPPHS